jgi:hypothetical protein
MSEREIRAPEYMPVGPVARWLPRHAPPPPAVAPLPTSPPTAPLAGPGEHADQERQP